MGHNAPGAEEAPWPHSSLPPACAKLRRTFLAREPASASRLCFAICSDKWDTKHPEERKESANNSQLPNSIDLKLPNLQFLNFRKGVDDSLLEKELKVFIYRLGEEGA